MIGYFKVFIEHLEKMQNEIQSFYDDNKNLPKVGFEKEHSEQLAWGMSQRKYVIDLVGKIEDSTVEKLEDWFIRHNNFLASYEGDPINNYIAALMRANCMMRTASDLLYEIEKETQ